MSLFEHFYVGPTKNPVQMKMHRNHKNTLFSVLKILKLYGLCTERFNYVCVCTMFYRCDEQSK